MSTMQIIIFAAVFVTLVLLILFYDRIRRSKIFQNSEDKAAERAARKAAKEEEYFRRTSQKHYRKEEADRLADFDKDYFKSADDAKEEKTAETPNDSARRTTTSGDGVTIIDDRQPAKDTQKKKIFEGDEGEYVEFEEV